MFLLWAFSVFVLERGQWYDMAQRLLLYPRNNYVRLFTPWHFRRSTMLTTKFWIVNKVFLLETCDDILSSLFVKSSLLSCKMCSFDLCMLSNWRTLKLKSDLLRMGSEEVLSATISASATRFRLVICLSRSAFAIFACLGVVQFRLFIKASAQRVWCSTLTEGHPSPNECVYSLMIAVEGFVLFIPNFFFTQCFGPTCLSG